MSQSRKWQVLPQAPKNFLEKNTDADRLLYQLLYNRGFKAQENIKEFLEAEKSPGHDPFLLKDMGVAVDLVIKHLKEGNKIFIYGDYDADGITSSALLYDLFSIFNSTPGVYMPDRIKEGYGLNREAIKEIADQDTGLIITVDTGIRNKEEVSYAQSLGMDVIITDHHIPPEKKEDLPDCLIIDPVLDREKYPFKKLAGVGVAYKLAQALIAKSTLKKEQKKIIEERLLDLVAIGTVADCVDLVGENRVLVKKGLKVLNHTQRVGLQELINSVSLKDKIDSWNIGFQIAPRINASSRMDHAARAFYLLISRDRREAKEKAGDLNKKNSSRQQETEKVLSQALEQAGKSKDKIIVVFSGKKDFWPEGIIGLVAGRLNSLYYRPALVIARAEGELKGSGRSIEEFNLVKALEDSKELLSSYGGHPAACGFSLPEENLSEFLEKIKKYSNKKLRGTELLPKIYIDSELDLRKVDEELFVLLEKLAPFGEGNPRPVFLSKGVQIRDIIRMGKQGEHIKFRLNGIWGVFFGQAKNCSDFKIGDEVDVVYYIDMNKFNGKSELQLKIIDIS